MDRRTGIPVTALLVVIGVVVLLLRSWSMAGEDSRAASRRDLADAVLPDIVPPRRIAMVGDVAIVGIAGQRERVASDATDGPSRYRQGCDGLCAAVLAMPRVTSVTVAAVDRVTGEADGAPTRFRLMSRQRCRGETIRPQEPDRLDDPGGFGGTQSTAWSLRLSTQDCIVADTAQGIPDITIAYRADTTSRNESTEQRWSLDPFGVRVARLEIQAPGGVPLYRRSHAETETLGWPLRPGIVGITGLIMPVFGWHRVPLTNDGLIETPDPGRLILAHTDLRPMTTADLSAKVRARIAEVTGDRRVPADDPAFDLVDGWLWELAEKPVDAADLKLVIALIRDRRAIGFRGIWRVTSRLGPAADALREPILRRIDRDGARRDEKTRGAVKALAAQLPLLPKTDRTLALEQTILRDPEKRLTAKGVIMVQAYRGAAAVPLLLHILREHAERSAAATTGRYEIEPIDGVQAALCRIGPAARAAVPAIRRMTAAGLFPKHLIEDRYWQAMLARIGTPVREIPKPTGLSGTRAEFEARLAEQARSAGENGACGESLT